MFAVVHLGLLLLLPPLLQGVLVKTKSWFSGRTGPGPLQPYRDLGRLLRKGATFSAGSTAVFRLGPAAAVAAAFIAGLLVPLVPDHPLWGFAGDFVVFAYVLGLGRF
jgi:formate hydrogenlyase subunit 4